VRNQPVLVEILRACVMGDAATLDAAARHASAVGAPVDGLADLAIEQGVAGSVYRHLDHLPELAPTERHLLGANALRNRIDHGHIGRDLRYLDQLLKPLGAPWVIVKGPAVAATLYSPPEIRAAGDIDVLIAPADFPGAIELLERAGHPVDDANWPLVRQLTAGQLHMVLPNGTILDLHWHLLFDAAERARYPLTTTELIARRRTVAIAGIELATLDPVDTLIHLCYHAANEGADRLGWLNDVSRAAGVTDLDWDGLVARAVRWRMQLPVGTVLQRARQQLGAPVPASVTERLMPATWRTMMTLADRMFPVATTARRVGSPASLLVKSAAVSGASARASTAAAASGLTRRALRLAQTGDAARVDPHRSDTPASLEYRAEFSALDRDAYFAAVGAVHEG
jgi:hypothetical protein